MLKQINMSELGYNMIIIHYKIQHLSNFGDKRVYLEVQSMVLKNEY